MFTALSAWKEVAATVAVMIVLLSSRPSRRWSIADVVAAYFGIWWVAVAAGGFLGGSGLPASAQAYGVRFYAVRFCCTRWDDGPLLMTRGGIGCCGCSLGSAESPARSQSSNGSSPMGSGCELSAPSATANTSATTSAFSSTGRTRRCHHCGRRRVVRSFAVPVPFILCPTVRPELRAAAAGGYLCRCPRKGHRARRWAWAAVAAGWLGLAASLTRAVIVAAMVVAAGMLAVRYRQARVPLLVGLVLLAGSLFVLRTFVSDSRGAGAGVVARATGTDASG